MLGPQCWLVFLFAELISVGILSSHLLGQRWSPKDRSCNMLLDQAVMDEYGTLVQWWLAVENQRTWRETCSSTIFVCGKPHIHYSWIEPRLLWWESDIWLLELWHSDVVRREHYICNKKYAKCYIWIAKLLFTDLGVWILSVDDIFCDLSTVSSSYCLSKLNRQRKQQTLEW
jgi:hypothetical protein